MTKIERLRDIRERALKKKTEADAAFEKADANLKAQEKKEIFAEIELRALTPEQFRKILEGVRSGNMTKAADAAVSQTDSNESPVKDENETTDYYGYQKEDDLENED